MTLDEIETRLRDTADSCLKAYAGWSKSRRDSAAREVMAEAVHELRKVCARLEIELGASERDELSQRPIPVPPHRSAQRRHQEEGMPQFITTGYDDGNDDDDGPQPMQNRGRQQHSGGGGQRGGYQNHQQPRSHSQHQQQPRQQQSQQQQSQEQPQQQQSAPSATGKTVTLERRFGRGRPAAGGGEAAAAAPKPEAAPE